MPATNDKIKAFQLKRLLTELESFNKIALVSTIDDIGLRCLRTSKKSHRESAREEKGCKSQSAFLSLCPKLALSRGGPSGKSAGGRPPESAGLQHISCGWLKCISSGWLQYISSSRVPHLHTVQQMICFESGRLP